MSQICSRGKLFAPFIASLVQIMYPRSPVESIKKFHQELTLLRRDLHANPEIGFQEVRTASIVAGALEALGIEVHRGVGRTGVVGVIRGQRHDSGRSIGLRADMDALPIKEEGVAQYCSTVPGLMHACGHDGHTAILLGAAKYLAQNRQFNGTVVLIFQPAEESVGGAKLLCDKGLLKDHNVSAIFGIHLFPEIPEGTLASRPGEFMAMASEVNIEVIGKTAHGAMPHLGIDSNIILAKLIN